jgi:hypothetical protein
LLFGPSPFEHWFKSCKLFTVRSLFFSNIANQSWFSPYPLLPPCVLLLCSACWCPCRRCSTSILATAGHLLCLPCHALLPHPLTALAPFCWSPARAPHFFRWLPAPPAGVPAATAILTQACLSFPLFCSIAPVAHPRFFCPVSLLAQPAPNPFRLRRLNPSLR